MAKISKNSRNASKTDVFNHRGCGAMVQMRSVMKKGKIRHYAECTGPGCHQQARRIRDLI